MATSPCALRICEWLLGARADLLEEADEIDQLATDAMADACFPGNPREANHDDVVALFKKICPAA